MVDLGRISALRAAYADGLTPHAVVEAVLERIASRGDDSTWISRFDAATLHARAAALEAAWSGRARPPLYGVPFAIKDNIDVAGLPTTAACPAFAYSPAADATSVRLLLEAGAIAVGKTNLDQFATGLNGTRSPYGAPESVFGGDLISGGSSSGSAVAVAARVVPFALGTDTAGSGRVPAALNGIVGLKPTRGLVSTSGAVPACRSLDCVSIFTTDLDDAAAVLAVLAHPAATDPRSRPAPVGSGPARVGSGPAPGESRDPARRVRDACTLALPERIDTDPGFAERFATVADSAAARADHVVRTPIGPLLEAGDLLYGPWVTERLATLADFLATHPDDVLPVTRTVIERGATVDGASVFRAIHRLQEIRAWTDRLWERADVLLLPTIPTTFTRAQLAEEPLSRNLVLGRFTQNANLLDLAAVAVPAGTSADGRPFGVTLLGPAFSEDRLITAAQHLFKEAS